MIGANHYKHRTSFISLALFGLHFGLCIFLSACSNNLSQLEDSAGSQHSSTTKKKKNRDILSEPVSIHNIVEMSSNPMSTEEAKEGLSEAGRNWFYGQGIGQTMLNVSTVIAFPPYALYLLGNAGMAFAGYEPIYVTNALPEKPKQEVLSAYDSITGIPGRINSLIAGLEYNQE